MHTTPSLPFSIIIPLEFNRGQEEACLKRWVNEMTYPRDRYEVLAAGCRFSLGPEMVARLGSLLGSGDRLLLYDEPHDVALCAHAAKEARGEMLFFTEAHCLPDPDALTLAQKALEAHPSWAGFSGRSLPITHDQLSIAEAELYEADIRYGMGHHPWRKILDQCFVVRAGEYFQAGGFQADFGHFAEWYLAARMHKQGFQIGYTADVRIAHYYAGDPQELIEFSADFARGELIYHSRFPDDQCRSYFEAPAHWQLRDRWRAGLARRLFKLARQTPAGPRRSGRTARRYRWLLGWWIRSRSGSAMAVLRSILLYHRANWNLRMRMQFGLPASRLRGALTRLVGATIELERIRFVRGWIAEQAALPALAQSGPAVWHAEDTHAFRSVGLYPEEVWQARRFRWSEPVGMLEAHLPAGDYAYELEWLPLKEINHLLIFLDERRLDFVRQGQTASGSFSLSSPCSVRFAWACEMSGQPGDSRLLGLPVASVSWRRVGALES